MRSTASQRTAAPGPTKDLTSAVEAWLRRERREGRLKRQVPLDDLRQVAGILSAGALNGNGHGGHRSVRLISPTSTAPTTRSVLARVTSDEKRRLAKKFDQRRLASD